MDRGFNEINNVVRKSDLEPHSKELLEAKLESRKSNVGKWREAQPDGPFGPAQKIPDVMLHLEEKEASLVKDIVRGLQEMLERVLVGNEDKMLMLVWGGPAGSEPLDQQLQERFDKERVKIVITKTYSYVTVP